MLHINDTSTTVMDQYGFKKMGAFINVDDSIYGGAKPLAISGNGYWYEAGLYNMTKGPGQSPQIRFGTSRGTAASRQSSLPRDDLGAIYWEAFDASSVGPNWEGWGGAAGIRVSVPSNSTNGEGGDIVFGTSPASTSSIYDRLIIKNDGNVGIGTMAPDGKLNIAGGGSWTTNGWNKSRRSVFRLHKHRRHMDIGVQPR